MIERARTTARRIVGHGRRRQAGLVGALAIAGLMALGLVGVALAVHDEGFQLEGNATAADLTFGASTSGPAVHPAGSLSGDFAGPVDWDSLFNISGTPAPGNADGTVTGPKASLPTGFTAADFEKDFLNTGTTFGTGDHTTFATGSKDTLDVTPGWQCNFDHNVNSKTDIINGFASVLEKDGDKFFYYGLEKDKNNGDNNVGLWLFQDPTVGCTSVSGTVSFTGHHTNGDLLIVSAFTNGGGVSNITIYQWLNGALVLVPPSGIDCLVTGGNDSACATVNELTISMPWLTADDGVVNAQKQSPNFFEGGINLSDFPEFADTCFNRFLLDTRSSQSTTATLFDYVEGNTSTCKPDLHLVKTPDTGTYFQGQSFNWDIAVSNTGDGAATGAVVSDTIATGLTIGTPTTPAGTCNVVGQVVTCTVDVAVGATIHITVPVTVTGGVFSDPSDTCVPVDNSATVVIGTDTSSDTGQVTACRLSIEKTAVPTFTRTNTWDIDKSVDPSSFVFFDGQSGTADYRVDVTKTVTDSAWHVTGTITVHNPAPIDATLTSLTDSISGPGAPGVTPDCGGSLTVPAGGTLVCTYSADLPNATTRTNTASAVAYTVTYTGTASINFSGVTPTVVGPNSVDVTDAFDGGAAGALGTTSDSHTYFYSRDFDCSGITFSGSSGSRAYPNTAEITQTGQTADANVDVTCYRLTVSKTATPAFTRTNSWDIDKSVTPDSWTFFDGQSGTSDYTVDVTKTVTDSAYSVSGSITVHNPAPMAATLTSVTDAIDGAGAPSVTPVCGSLTVPAGGDLVCTYSANLPDDASRTNTASAVAYTVTYTGTASIDFTGVNPTVVGPDTVDVTDNFDGGGASALAGSPISDSHTFHYSRDFDCSGIDFGGGTSGSRSYPNTAEITQTGQTDDANVDVTCYRLTVTKTATPSFTRTNTWTIDKSVTPDTFSFFDGQTGTAHYSVLVTKTVTDSDWAVSGTITVHNPAPIVATLSSLTDTISGAGAPSVTPDCGGATTVPAGGDLVCTYSADLPDAATRTNTATATAYTVDYTGTASIDFTNVVPTVVGDDTINVTDDVQGDLGSTSSTHTFTYDRPEDCSDIAYTDGVGTKHLPNTATIVETNQSDDAAVDVTCYRLSVSKTATPTFDRHFDWTITKSGDQTEVTANFGDQVTINYTITVVGTQTDSGWHVTGTVTVHNPAPMDATLDSLTDEISGLGAVSLDCGGSLTVPAGGDLVCTYSSDLPDAASRTNTATATAYTVDYTGTAPIDFSGVSPTVTGQTPPVTVTDSYAGTLGTADIGTSTFNYSRTIDTTTLGCGDFNFPNTATIVETGQTSDWNVLIHVINCGTPGKTPGFWGNNNGHAILDANHDGNLDTPVTIGAGAHTFTVTTIAQSDKILGNNDCGGGSPTIFTCTGPSGLLGGINKNSFEVLGAQTLALTYNIGNISGFAGQTLSALSVNAYITPALAGLGVTPSTTVDQLLAISNNLIANSFKPGGTATQIQIGDMNSLLGQVNRETL